MSLETLTNKKDGSEGCGLGKSAFSTKQAFFRRASSAEKEKEEQLTAHTRRRSRTACKRDKVIFFFTVYICVRGESKLISRLLSNTYDNTVKTPKGQILFCKDQVCYVRKTHQTDDVLQNNI